MDPATRSLPVAKGRPRLVVIAGGHATSYVVPLAGEIMIGRDARSDVRIDDPSISRSHVRVRVGETITVEDLGSSNGTVVRGARLVVGTPVEIGFDEAITVGSISVLVQKQTHAHSAPVRTLWGHGYFELRLAEECTRAARATTTFGLLRVRAQVGAEDRLSAAVREIDVIGTYAPGEWEVLLLDASSEETERVVAAVRAAIPQARVALAMFPVDGNDAWALASRISRQLVTERTPGEPATLNPIGAMKPLVDLIDRVAVGDISVLVLGETGSGKELVAEAIHRRSRRANASLLKLNCAALPEQLLESELFGHEKGAFTGAVAAKSGLLEEADGGSIFLDEIGELPPSTQAKLLRVIEQREFLRVGALKARTIDVRFIAATHQDLDDAIAGGRFREDLYFRLAGVTLEVPPLRERRGEIEPLVTRFIERTADGLEREPPTISKPALALLHSYHWPGNVRELRNVIERATLLCDGVIEPEHLPQDRMSRPSIAASAPSGLDGVKAQTELLEKRAIEDALAQAHGNQTEAARTLGISRRTLTNKLNLYKLDRPRKR